MPQLDGLRALAVLGVLVLHFTPAASPIKNVIPLGAGVTLFFVLSGYLTTRTLLNARQLAEPDGEAALWRAWRRFHARRLLRVVPPYYILIGIAAAVGCEPVRNSFWWHVCYATNWGFLYSWGPEGVNAHLWFVSVMEQFYLVWPLFMIFLPERRLMPAVLGAIAVGPVTRVICQAYDYSPFHLFMWPTSSFDALGVGALLAMLSRRDDGVWWRYKLGRWGLAAGLPVYYIGFLADRLTGEFVGVYESLGVAGLALFCFWLIDRASSGFQGVAGWLLSWWPLCWVGKVSYTVYLAHMFVASAIGWLASRLHVGGFTDPFSMLVLIAATLGVAAVSWYLVERPVSRLRDRFRTT